MRGLACDGDETLLMGDDNDGGDVTVGNCLGASRDSRVGMKTVRGRSLPLEAILGVPIWRERTRDVCASMR